jgi:predicted aminopeptidase
VTAAVAVLPWRLAVPALALALAGCGAVEYYWQGAVGQLELLVHAKPVAEVVATTDDEALRMRLSRLQAIRAYASADLALPDNASYTRYTELGRPYVVWNVFAAPALSLTPRQWCFPVAGCVAYRGYFAEADARAEAARLAALGDDVHVSGVPAYSTLGWFDDPALSTFIRWREADLARLVFHELAHQVVYVKDDTAFNESFATAVEEAGLSRWLAAQARRPDAAAIRADAERSRVLRREWRALTAAARERLREVYASSLPEADKLREKAAAFVALRAGYDGLVAKWGPLPGYDRWFAGGANNAGLAAGALYADRVAAFAALLAAEDGDLPRFYARVRTLAAMPRAARDAALAALDEGVGGSENAGAAADRTVRQ